MIVKRKTQDGTIRYGVVLYEPATRKKRWVGTYDLLKDARAAERKAIDKRGRSKRATVGTYAERWLDVHHGPGTKRPEWTTYLYNVSMLEPFLAEFRGRDLSSFTRSEAIDWARDHRHNAKVVSALFNDAIREDKCDLNPFANMGLSGSAGRSDITPVTEDEVARLGEIALERWGQYGPTCRAWVLFAAWVGLRPGEMFALNWEDLDLEAGLVNIERQRRIDGVHKTKTKKSRKVILPPVARDALLEMHRIRRGLLFTTGTGKPVSKGSYRYYWDPVRTAFEAGLSPERRAKLLAGRDNLDLYELRHFCGSMLADRGLTEFDISAQLGNSPEVCREVYIHAYEDRVRDRLRAAFDMNVTPLREAGNG